MDDNLIWTGSPDSTPDGWLWIPGQCGECKVPVGSYHHEACSGVYHEKVVTQDGARRGWD